jgi:adenosylhomocysteine nucleosidase
MFLVLTAVLPEARALVRAFHLAACHNPLPMWQGDGWRLACVGIRGARLPQLVQSAGFEKPQLVVMAGLAGALSPGLRVGDVVVDGRGLLPPLPPLGDAIFGRLHTSPRIASTPAHKANLFQQTGCLAVDMESDVARAFAASVGAAFMAIRGISDSADELLDPKLLNLVDAGGKPHVGRVMTMLCLRPWKIAAMLRLMRDSDRAMIAVARTLELLLASGWPPVAANRPSTS